MNAESLEHPAIKIIVQGSDFKSNIKKFLNYIEKAKTDE